MWPDVREPGQVGVVVEVDVGILVMFGFGVKVGIGALGDVGLRFEVRVNVGVCRWSWSWWWPPPSSSGLPAVRVVSYIWRLTWREPFTTMMGGYDQEQSWSYKGKLLMGELPPWSVMRARGGVRGHSGVLGEGLLPSSSGLPAVTVLPPNLSSQMSAIRGRTGSGLGFRSFSVAQAMSSWMPVSGSRLDIRLCSVSLLGAAWQAKKHSTRGRGFYGGPPLAPLDYLL